MSLQPKNIAIIGSSGAIGTALTRHISERYPNSSVFPFSRSSSYKIDYQNENSIAEAAEKATVMQPLDLVIVTTGLLHADDLMPEKTIRELSAEKVHRVFEANTITPMLIAKHFLPKLNHTRTSIFAALSARLGSISDNRLGGWYSYRASKAALNMLIRNSAIEVNRQHKKVIIVGLHPGTVNSRLSKPFQRNIKKDGIFSPGDAAEKLISVIENLKASHSGKCYGWDAKEILP